MARDRKTTPEHVTSLAENEVFVFGSNKEGQHWGGAAKFAYDNFGTEWGVGIGMTGQSYAIPTMDGDIEIIRRYVKDFTDYAKAHPEQAFLVTPIGCGIAGWRAEEIAPLFKEASRLDNVSLPESFWNIIEMTAIEAIRRRHSVRRYRTKPIPEEIQEQLRQAIQKVNEEGALHVQIVIGEPKAFSGPMAYGKFSGVTNYLVMAGTKADDLDERIGYYGERLVLLAQQLGLNSCWAGVSYRKISGTYELKPDEKIGCYIALGYGETQGVQHKCKSVEEISNVSGRTPSWFYDGVEAARLAPTAVNQQKFFIECLGKVDGGLPKVRISKGFSMVGYTQMDMGIAKLHFEIGAGKENFDWVTE